MGQSADNDAVRPVAVLLSPVVPRPTGAGMPMRAWDWLVELSENHDVHLIVVGTSGNEDRADSEESPAISVLRLTSLDPAAGVRRAARFIPPLAAWRRSLASNWRTIAAADLPKIRSLTDGLPVEQMVTMRLYMHDVAQTLEPILAPRRTTLDLDDVESATILSVAAGQLRMRRLLHALWTSLTGLQYLVTERTIRARYDNVHVASTSDAGFAWLGRLGTHIRARPNRVAMPSGVVSSPIGDPVRLLFVGSLHHSSNEEAARWIAGPLRRALDRAGIQWTAEIVGNRPRPELQVHFSRDRRISLAGDVARVAPHYVKADVVLAPVRAGGGTKIKSLEAIAYLRPLVASAHATRGLPLTPNDHYLHCRSARDAARQIKRLMTEPGLRPRLATAARRSIVEAELVRLP